MGWLDVRRDVEAQISVFEATLGEWRGHQATIADARSRLYSILTGSHHALALDGMDTIDRAPGHAAKATQHLTHAIQLCHDYLHAVDPDGANGSIRDLEPPQPQGATHGGNGGPDVPPARQPITDPSRRRSHVYTEQGGPGGLADLQDRDDGILAARRDWIRCGGHAVDRHGGGVTDQQLKDRAVHGQDPITGNTVDWEHGRDHSYSRDATAFASDSDLVYAEMRAYDSRLGQERRAAAEAAGRYQYSVLIPASSVFGPEFRDHLRGWSRIGSAKNPEGVQPTNFTDDAKIFVGYRRASDTASWVAYTCFVRPGN